MFFFYYFTPCTLLNKDLTTNKRDQKTNECFMPVKIIHLLSITTEKGANFVWSLLSICVSVILSS